MCTNEPTCEDLCAGHVSSEECDGLLIGWGLKLEGSDSSGNNTSDCGVVGALVFPRLLYADSCSEFFSLTLLAYRVSVFPSCRLLRFVGTAFLAATECLCEVVFRSYKHEPTTVCI